ncbi:hypothetical protein [Nocardiopsis lucentensis]|uniref:hypothetical protein n=1 Tax=Nocardiopsis lucentensis TaxID=53441 RepID=UPI0003487FEF|nr:hypothetical protein [Nocardiopsis lucentensis]
MRVRATAVLTPLACLALAGVLTTACSTDDARVERARAAREEMARAAGALSVTALRPAAERAFARAGHPIDGVLACANEPPITPSGSEADQRSAEADERAEHGTDERTVRVHCTGTTRDGESVRFEGRLSPRTLAERETGDEGLRGAFNGSVGGAEVFAMDCFQCAPALAGDTAGATEREAGGAGTAEDPVSSGG